MRNMTLILIVLILFGGILLISGCVTTSPFETQQIQGSIIRNIRVSSEPGDAEIYVNNMLVGRTPSRPGEAQTVPLNVQYIVTKYGGLFPTAQNTTQPIKPISQFVLKVSKEGYKDAAEPVEYGDVYRYHITFAMAEDYTLLKKDSYYFVLEKKE